MFHLFIDKDLIRYDTPDDYHTPKYNSV